MKRFASRLWFYFSVGVLNLAVAVMFYVITIKPPVVHASSPDSLVSRALARKPHIVPAIQGIPVRIVIPSVSIDLPVGAGSYNPNDGTWTVDATKAYYADTSVPINDSNGQTLIYGHNQSPVFAPLANLPDGATADVYTDTGYVFHYRYTSLHKVLPTDMSVFRVDGPPTLVLQTCTGAWDAYRAMYSFKLESEQKV